MSAIILVNSWEEGGEQTKPQNYFDQIKYVVILFEKLCW